MFIVCTAQSYLCLFQLSKNSSLSFRKQFVQILISFPFRNYVHCVRSKSVWSVLSVPLSVWVDWLRIRPSGSSSRRRLVMWDQTTHCKYNDRKKTPQVQSSAQPSSQPDMQPRWNHICSGWKIPLRSEFECGYVGVNITFKCLRITLSVCVDVSVCHTPCLWELPFMLIPHTLYVHRRMYFVLIFYAIRPTTKKEREFHAPWPWKVFQNLLIQ